MSSDWYLMTRPLFDSGYESDEFTLFAQDGFEEVLESFLGTDVAIYDSKLSDTPVQTRAIIQNITTDVINNSNQRQILCRIGTLRCGQYVLANGVYWIVCSKPDNNQMYEKALLWLCKYSLKFMSPKTHEVVTYPAYIINSTQYNSGETAKTYMTIGTSQNLIYVPYNDETIMLDHGTRFLIDKNTVTPTAFRITQVDTTSYSVGVDGLLQWSVMESVFDPKTDNKELMVADYYGISEYTANDPVDTGYSIVLEADSGYIIYGETNNVSVSLCNNGSTVELDSFTCEIIDGDEYATIEEQSEDGFVVRALKNKQNIGQEVTIRVTNQTNSIHQDIVFEIRGWY